MRNYKRKTNQANWNEDDMKNAITAVMLKQMSLRKACKNASVPKVSLHCCVKKASLESSLHINSLRRFRKLLSDNQEQDPNKYIKVTSGEKGVTTTNLRACRSAGHYIRLIMIFKHKKKENITNRKCSRWNYSKMLRKWLS